MKADQPPLPEQTALSPAWVSGVHAVLDGIFFFFGAWTLLCWPLVLLGGSFDLLTSLSWLPLLATAAFVAWSPRPALPPPALDDSVQAGPALRGGAACAAVLAAYWWSGSYLLLWTGALMLLASASLAGSPQEEAEPRLRAGAGRESLLALTAVSAVAMLITLLAHRASPDDSFYLNIVVTALDKPGQALLGNDGMFGEPGLPLLENWYRLKSYEPLVAVLARLSGIAPKTLYYVALPPVLATLTVVANWSALRMLGGRLATLGAAVVVVVLAAWAGVPEAFGNFAFVRLFQGKAIALTVCVPAVIAYASRFAVSRDLRSFVLLALVQVAALGISGSAIVAVPTAAIATLLGWSMASRRGGVALVGVAASLLIAAVAATTLLNLSPDQDLALSWKEFAALPRATQGGLSMVLGSGSRAALALLALMLAPLLAPQRSRRAVIGLALVLLLVMMNPLLPAYFGRISARATWRMFWAVPFPLLLGLLAQRLATLRIGASSGTAAGLALSAGLVVAFVGFRGDDWTLSPANGTDLRLPGAKVSIWHELAGAVVAASAGDDLVLAPYEIAQWVPTYALHPRLVGVRMMYYGPLRDRPEEETAVRVNLVSLLTYGKHWSPRRNHEVLASAQALGVDVVVLRTNDVTPSLRSEFEAIGCNVVVAVDSAPLSFLKQNGFEFRRCRHKAEDVPAAAP